jgi:hypothetical protein
MAEETAVVFEEVQDAPWPFRALGMGGAAVGGWALARALSLLPRLGVGGLVAGGVGLVVNQFLLPMSTTLLRDELQVRFGRRTRFRIPLKYVVRAYARDYNAILEYGGWGIRVSGAGRAFNLRGQQGVQLVLRSGQRVLVGSQRPQELAEAIRSVTGCDGAPE